MNEVLDFVVSQNWSYRQSGDELEIGCPMPECPNKGQKQFYINQVTQKWSCRRCNAGGHNLTQLKFKLGVIKFESADTDYIVVNPKDIDKWHDDLVKNQEAMRYLTVQRGLGISEISQYRLGLKIQENVPVIVMPTFDTDEACVALKYDFYTLRGDKKHAKYKLEQGSKIQAFGLDLVDRNQALVITEGEYDAISAWHYGYENVISIPNGVNGLTDWIEEIKDFPKYYICFDKDKAGQEGVSKLAGILGRAKCFKVALKLKDLNKYLECGIEKEEVDACFKNAKPLFDAPVVDIASYEESAVKQLLNPEIDKGVSTGWKCIDEILGGIRMGELTVASGISGHGKTTFGTALAGNLLPKGIRPLIVSPEMSEQDLLIDFANNYWKEQVSDPERLKHVIRTYNNKLYIANVFDSWTTGKKESLAAKLFDIIDYSVGHKGVNFVLVDHMRLFISALNPDHERNAIDNFLSQCVHTAIKNKIHIYLVVQPRKQDQTSMVCKTCSKQMRKKITMSDLKGSGNIEQDAHNIILVHRFMRDYCSCKIKMNETLVEIEVAKNRKLGPTGTVTLTYDTKSGNNYFERA